MRENHNTKKYLILLIGAVTVTGMILRFLSCTWGAPLQLHADEWVIVENALSMLSKHTWFAESYNRPDQFEIKCDALIFTVYSWIRYHKPAYEVLDEHRMDFYILARGFTAVFGTLLIPLSAVFTGYVFENSRKLKAGLIQALSVILIAFGVDFVEHSAFATPDIVLTFFVLLFAYFFIRYIEEGRKTFLYACIAIIGISVTIKYPAALLCAPLAFMVIYRKLRIEKKPWDILRYALISIFLIILEAFLIAPNLFLSFGKTVETIMVEARPIHLGADGLGFSGNLKYYLSTVTDRIGNVSAVFFLSGIVFLLLNRSRRSLSLLIGIFYWVCMSALSLHWLRWGLPFYVFFCILAAAGIAAWVYWIGELRKKIRPAGLLGLFPAAAAGALLLNVILSGFATVKNNLIPDARITALEYCAENMITEENTLYEGYTSFAPRIALQRWDAFHFEGDKLCVNLPFAGKKYFMMSTAFVSRYRKEKDRYPEEYAMYEAIEKQLPLVYREKVDGNYLLKANILENIPYTAGYLKEEFRASGSDIFIYELDPHYVLLSPAGEPGLFLGAETDEIGTGTGLYAFTMPWAQYVGDQGMTSFITPDCAAALDVKGGRFLDGDEIELWKITGEAPQQWKRIDENGISYLVTSNDMALTAEGNNVTLRPFAHEASQQWLIRDFSKDWF